MVWRTRQPQHEGAVHGLAQRFFCHFLHRWSIIITDSAQTNAAKVMWEGMVAWALRDPEHYVYVWDGTGESGCLHPVRSWLAFSAQSLRISLNGKPGGSSCPHFRFSRRATRVRRRICGKKNVLKAGSIV